MYYSHSLFVQALAVAAALRSAAGHALPRSHSSRTVGNFGPTLDKTTVHHYESPLSNPSPQLSASDLDPALIAKQHLAKALGVSADGLVVSSSYRSKHNGVTHVYLRQLIGGLEIANGVANVNVDRAGRVISFGSTLFQSASPSVEPALRLQDDASDDVVLSVAAPAAGHEDVSAHIDLADSRIKLSPSEAVARLAEFVGLQSFRPSSLQTVPINSLNTHGPQFVVKGASFSKKDIPTKLKYIQIDAAGAVELRLVWDIEMDLNSNWYHAHVDTETGKVLQLVDWVADAAYNVYPIGTNDPNDGERVLVHDPAHKTASPLGWHAQHGPKGKNFTVTAGNNAFAQNNPDGGDEWESNYRPNGGDNLIFDFPVDLKRQQPTEYEDAAITNLFYWNNAIHDLFYTYGFDEESGNFQFDNFGRGGKGNDFVIANAQDGSGTNNANFATPPDGQNGRMRMYIWDVTDPNHDGDLEGGIIMHEYAHGISTRLTGGPDNSGCLGWGEAGGMGEGWGDYFATILRTTSKSTREDDFTMGSYANGGNGIRKFPYSTSKKTNPSTYAFVMKPAYFGVHAKGEVWAEILYEVFWNLVEKHGYDPDWYNNGFQGDDDDGSELYRDFRTGALAKRSFKKHKGKYGGNVIALQIVLDGMKLQPCFPNFISARDAILQADEVDNSGENSCEIWKGFAKRGLGVNAKNLGRENFDLPKHCRD
ncbi:Fungalysin metallopeptidase-domain-containing protein [Polychytrium aggregatum]|uniref:Fungalysin metallopeptidase-domain-containing protein n=1 Tax=Polychytrium aggregatum TaxID=110093 RepID=UPI0022FEE772|nr:Fungalysin metallopeptidase-domain-containing protein [Polychytrium aggregatum]KAI9207125.1 Fungalysin metallopeptidase-domain-containing protein [Polychytrium aggregatum]